MELLTISPVKKKARKLKFRNRLIMLLVISIFLFISVTEILTETALLIAFTICSCICISLFFANRKLRRKGNLLEVYNDYIIAKDETGRLTRIEKQSIDKFVFLDHPARIVVTFYFRSSRGAVVKGAVDITFETTNYTKEDIKNLTIQLENYRTRY